MDLDKKILLGFGRNGASEYEKMYLACAIQRLEGFGMDVTVRDPACWDYNFDYSKYDIVGLIASCNPVKDPEHLYSVLSSQTIGFIVFGAWNAASTLKYIGLLKDDQVKVKHQSASCVRRASEDHFITEHFLPNIPYDFGIKYVSCALYPGTQTRVLLHVDGDAALVVHTKLRALICHWTGDPSQHHMETAQSIECTRRCLLWAAGTENLRSAVGPPFSIPPSLLPSVAMATTNDMVALYGTPNRLPAPFSADLPPSPFATLINDLWQLVDNEEYADVVFVFQDRRLYANRAILSVRCPFLKAWIERERNAAPTTTGRVLEIIVGEQICSQAFYVVLLFLYTTSVPPDLPITTLVNVLVTAQDCGLPDLKQLCEDLILKSLEAHNAIPLLVAAQQLGQMDIKDMALDYVARHMAEVKRAGPFELLKDYPELMLELLKL